MMIETLLITPSTHSRQTISVCELVDVKADQVGNEVTGHGGPGVKNENPASFKNHI